MTIRGLQVIDASCFYCSCHLIADVIAAAATTATAADAATAITEADCCYYHLCTIV